MNSCEMDVDTIAQEDDRRLEDIEPDGDEISKLILCLYIQFIQPVTCPSCFIRAFCLNSHSSLFATIPEMFSFLYIC